MGAPASVGVNDDLAACKPRVTLRAANDELTGGVDVEVREITEQAEGGLAALEHNLCQRLLHHLFHDQLVHLLHAGGGGVWTSVTGDLFAARRFQWLCVLGR